MRTRLARAMKINPNPSDRKVREDDYMESRLEATERKHHTDVYLICCPKLNYQVIRLIDDNSWGQHVHHEAGPFSDPMQSCLLHLRWTRPSGPNGIRSAYGNHG